MLLATLLCYVGFTAMCLSMKRHYDVLVGGVLSTGRSQALVQWFAALMSSAVLFVFVMSYWPRQALSLAVTGILLVPIAACIQLLA